MISDRRWYLTKDRDRAVEEGSLEAASLLVGEGCELHDATAHEYGLLPEQIAAKVAKNEAVKELVAALSLALATKGAPDK